MPTLQETAYPGLKSHVSAHDLATIYTPQPHEVALAKSGTRFRHIPIIRQFLHVQPYGKEARHVMLLALSEAARTKEDLADLINVAIEELVRKKYELPAFDPVVRAARHVRTVVYHQFYRQVDNALSAVEKADIERLFLAETETRFTRSNTL